VAWVKFFPVYDHWLQGQLEEALAEVNQGAQGIHSRSGAARNQWAWYAGGAYLTLGKLEAAEEMFQNVRNTPWRHQLLAMVAWARGDQQAVREILRRPQPSYFSAMLLARAGLVSEAQKLISNADTAKRGGETRSKLLGQMARGELAVARGQTAEAIGLLEDSVPALRPLVQPCCASYFFLGSESLALAWERQGEWQKALAVLEQASQERARVYYRAMSPGVFWMRIEWRRAEFYRKIGRDEEAREIEAELLKLLSYADPDHPILLQLKRAQDLVLAQSSK
ncbi:MAG: hypothetical protein V3S55_02250, partial [Nitrospiraceae bacterium]